MLAKDALIGNSYKLEARGNRPEGKAECIGWNHSHEWLLFLSYDNQGKRKVLMIGPQETVYQ